MKLIKTDLPEVLIIEPQVFGDHRGYFMETYSKAALAKLGITNDFIQDNQSFTANKGTLRGLHFQNEPMAQAKLVRVTRGAVLDVAVDLRRGSPTYLKWVGIELSAENKRMLFLPRGFGHAFLTLTDNVEFLYKADNYYSKDCDRSISFNDPSIGIDWGIQDPILLDKDINAVLVTDSDCNFVYPTGEQA